MQYCADCYAIAQFVRFLESDNIECPINVLKGFLCALAKIVNLFISPSTIISMARRERKAKHHFDRRELLIVVIVLVGSLSMFGLYEPSAKVVAKETACDGGSPNGFCDYAYKARCEAGCSDCDTCLQYCTQLCAEQGKFVSYCRSNYYCSCTDANPCVR